MTLNRPVIFGEVLFDCFPDGTRVLGGAPFNVAWHLRAFGQDPLVISRVGADAEGEEVRAASAEWGMDGSALQCDPALPTGRVVVRFDAGEPNYTIHQPAAFDAIDSQQVDPSVAGPGALLYHGSLALRSKASRESLQRLKSRGPGLTFVDVNLRPPWWTREEVMQSIEGADWVKLNQHELKQLCDHAGAGPEQARWLIERYQLDAVILTRSHQGALLLEAGKPEIEVRPQKDSTVVDTVGAGDAFTSVVLLGLLKNWPPERMLQRAQDFASMICGQRGATVRDARFYQSLVKLWSL